MSIGDCPSCFNRHSCGHRAAVTVECSHFDRDPFPAIIADCRARDRMSEFTEQCRESYESDHLPYRPEVTD